MSVHLQRGRLLASQGRHELALEELRLAASEEPDNAIVHATLAITLSNLERNQEATEAARRAVEKEPDWDYAHWALALVLVGRGELKDAEAAIRTAIELAPEDADNFGLLSRILLEQGRASEALAAADAGLALEPGNDLALTFRARALTALGRDDEAQAVADTLLAEDPEDAWNHQLRGDQMVRSGKIAEAQKHFVEALRLQPGMEAARVGLATCLKARSPVFGVLLRFLLLLNRLSTAVWWGIGILLFLTIRYGDGWAKSHPEWAVAYEAGKVLIWSVFLVVIVAHPVFDTLLSFDREGRRALSPDELKATRWYLACFGGAAFCAAWATLAQSGLGGPPVKIGFGALFLTRMVTEVFNAREGWVRTRMRWVAWAAVLSLLTAPAIAIVGLLQMYASRAQDGIGLVHVSIWLPTLSVGLSAFADNIRDWLERRRPDEV